MIDMKVNDKVAELEILKRRDMVDLKDDMIRVTVELVRRDLNNQEPRKGRKALDK